MSGDKRTDQIDVATGDLDPKAPLGHTASEFVARAIENNVLIIPGNVFSEQDTHFRISYATTDEKLAQGCDILCSLAG